MRRIAITIGFAVACVVAAVAAAEGSAPPYHVAVTGGEDVALRQQGASTTVAGVEQSRRSIWSGKHVTADRRTNGTVRVVLNEDAYRSGRVDFWTTPWTLRNARGSWRGSGFGFRDANGSHYVSAVGVGAGPYAGLVYRVMVVDYRSGAAARHLFEVYGWLERGKASIVPSVPTGHVKVTTRDATARRKAGMTVDTGGVSYTSGSAWSGATDASDARLDGTHRLVLDTFSYPGGRQDVSGSYTIRRGATATWRGRVWGVRTPDGRQIRWIDATGVGTNAGLRYRAVARSSAAAAARSQAWDTNGWIELRSWHGSRAGLARPVRPRPSHRRGGCQDRLPIGEVIATGTPEDVAEVEGSHTGRFLGVLARPAVAD